jgi:hypothetical protein
MLTDYIDAAENFVTCPNQDTVYGAGYQWLDSKPVVVQVPDFGDRFFTYQICDARTESFARISKQYGTKPGFYLLVGPNWKNQPPAGITAVFRSPTDLACVFPRAFQDDTPEDKAAIQSILSQIVVYPLSEFDGKMKTKDWKNAPAFPTPPGQGTGETKWVVPEKFFDELRSPGADKEANWIHAPQDDFSLYIRLHPRVLAEAGDPRGEVDAAEREAGERVNDVRVEESSSQLRMPVQERHVPSTEVPLLLNFGAHQLPSSPKSIAATTR